MIIDNLTFVKMSCDLRDYTVYHIAQFMIYWGACYSFTILYSFLEISTANLNFTIFKLPFLCKFSKIPP